MSINSFARADFSSVIYARALRPTTLPMSSSQSKLVSVAAAIIELPGALVLCAYASNELLMGLSPDVPLHWAIFYFPVRIAVVPFVGIIELSRLLLLIFRHPTRQNGIRGLVGLLVTGGIVWDLLGRRRH